MLRVCVRQRLRASANSRGESSRELVGEAADRFGDLDVTPLSRATDVVGQSGLRAWPRALRYDPKRGCATMVDQKQGLLPSKRGRLDSCGTGTRAFTKLPGSDLNSSSALVVALVHYEIAHLANEKSSASSFFSLAAARTNTPPPSQNGRCCYPTACEGINHEARISRLFCLR